PVGEDAFGDVAAGVGRVVADQLLEVGDVLGGFEFFEFDHFRVVVGFQFRVRVVDIGDSAAHAGGEIAPRRAEHDGSAAGHVFEAVVTTAFDDGVGSAVADAETLGGDTSEV